MATSERRMQQRRGDAADTPDEIGLQAEFYFEPDTENTTIADGVNERQDLPVFLQREAAEPMVENRVLLGGPHNNRVKSSAALRSDTPGQLNLGEEGETFGKATFYNEDSGSITEQATAGALGTQVQTRPARSGQICIGGMFDFRSPKTSGYTVILADRGVCFDATSGTWDLAFDPAATLGAHFAFAAINSGSGVITLNPNGSETIRDVFGSATTKTLAQGEAAIIICDGTGFLMLKFSRGAIWGNITGTLTDQTDLTAYIAAQIAAIVDSSPGTLDTLNELAAALADDPNFATTMTTALAGKQATLVSGTNIKTVGGTSLLGSGDVPFPTTATTQSAGDNSTNQATTAYADRTAHTSDYAAQTASFTFALADRFKTTKVNSASAINAEIPPNGTVNYPVGARLALVTIGAGQVTFTPGSGVTVNGRGGALKTAGQYAFAIAEQTATDVWIVTGDTTT